MTFILKVINPSNELVFDSNANGLYCVGKCTLQSLVQPNSNSATGPAPGKIAGYSTYRISWSGPVIFAIDLPLNKRVGILSVTQPSTGVWEVKCYCGDTQDAYLFDATQYQLDVWAYGLPTSASTGQVFQIFKTDGTIAYDLTKPNLLFPRAYQEAAARGSGITIPSLTRPVIIGCPNSTDSQDINISTNHWAFYSNKSMWRRTSSTAVVEETVMLQRYEYSATDPNEGAAGTDTFVTRSFILEGSTLP